MIAYPASLKAVGGARTGVAPVNLLDVQDVNGSIYYWSDRPIWAPSAGLGGAHQSITVPSGGSPWICTSSKNTDYAFTNGGSAVGAIIPCVGASSIVLSASGTVNTFPGAPAIGPNGGARPSDGGSVTLPSFFAGHSSAVLDFMGLVGAFTDSSGNVIEPVWIGASATLSVPPGAAQLQLGINDWIYGDNVGTFTVEFDTIGAPSAPVQYVPWVLSVPQLTFHRSAVTDVGNFVLQNLSGDSLARDFERLMRRSTLEGAFFVYRCWQPDAQAAWIEIHGKFTVDDVGVDTVTLKSSPAINPAEDDTPAEQYCETCQWRWSSAQCGATGSTECQYSYQTCQVPERILVVLNDYEKNYGEATANTPTQVINRRRKI